MVNLQGRFTLAARDGQLVDVEPGAGRVLGLLSVAELPRRLLLDFRDLFSKGFAFNRIGGTIAFADGQARSDDMNIDRSEEHTSELQSLMRISYAVFCLKKKK